MNRWTRDPRVEAAANALNPPGSTPLHPEDPNGPFLEPDFEGPAETAGQAFRQWSHRNKRWVYGFLLIAMLLSVVIATGIQVESEVPEHPAGSAHEPGQRAGGARE